MSLNSDLISVRFWSDGFQDFHLLHQKTSEVGMFTVSKGGFAPGVVSWTIKVADNQVDTNYGNCLLSSNYLSTSSSQDLYWIGRKVWCRDKTGATQIVARTCGVLNASKVYAACIKAGERKLFLFPSELVVVWPATGFPGNFWADNPFEPWE